MNLQVEELLSAVVERLIRALRAVHPPTVRHFFALANQHMRWELNDLARRLARIAHRVFLASAVSETGALLIGAGCRVVDFGRRNFCGRVLAHFGVGFYVLFAQAVAR
jgi:hypothetical protein